MTQAPIGQPFPRVLSPFPNRQSLAADLRNKLIAKIFFDMGIIEHYGMGITKIKEECAKNDNQCPKWDRLPVCPLICQLKHRSIKSLCLWFTIKFAF